MLAPITLAFLGAHFQGGTDTQIPLLLHHPTMNRESIVFSFGGSLWRVARDGGDAVRLTESQSGANEPCFSPDGTLLAFTANYGGQRNVYVMPAQGGNPRRLTFAPVVEQHPTWTPDGKNIIFTSAIFSGTDLPRLFSVPLTGGLPDALPLPSGNGAAVSPDGSHIAYDPGIKWQEAWKRYRGGQTSKIWIARTSDSKVVPLPRKNSNDTNPLWIGDSIYFLSDRGGPISLYRYVAATGKVTEVVKNDGLDFWSAGAGPDGVVIEQPGGIKRFDIADGSVHDVPIRVRGDFDQLRTRFKSIAASDVADVSLSPSGSRVVLEARGNIFTVPLEKGDARAIATASDIAHRSPAWSPDGKLIAYFSDAGGEYKLVTASADGKDTVPSTSYEIGEGPSFFFTPVWSPDSSKIAYRDNRHNLWVLDLKTKVNTKVDTEPYENVTWSPSLAWSPDSKWLTFHRDLDSHVNAVFLYNVADKKLTQLSDGLSDAKNPVFDAGGKYLYFYASTTSAPGAGWLDLSSYASINVVSSVYCVVLRNDLPSPFAPESDEEKVAPATPEKPAAKPAEFRIDLDGIDQRILAVPMSPGNYRTLQAGPEGTLFAQVVSPVASVVMPARLTLMKFSMADRKESLFAANVTNFKVSENKQKIALQQGPGISVVATTAPPAPGQGAVSLAGITVKVDPRAEWKQMYHEVWRIERDYFYDPHFHGQDLKVLEKRYAKFLDGIVDREDLNFVFTEMLGELSIGHMFIRGGDSPTTRQVPGGLLGADYKLDKGRYQLARVYNGESWNPGLSGPLTAPGVNGKAGEYLLAIDGKELTSSDNIYERLENTAGRQIRVKLGSNPDGTGGREVVVVPTPSEGALRHFAWIEDNRRTVSKLSGGKLGYVHVPDTNLGGWIGFNRYYFSQTDKAGMVIDERFNHGGEADDYMVETMTRPMRSMWESRYGKDFSSPMMQNFGPKVLLINEFSGSGGDYFPWHFRQAKVGPLIGKRTWGGLVGILEFPVLRDGGSVTAPNIAFYNPSGSFDVENHGVDPDIDVEMDPYQWRLGHDTQLEKGVAEAMHLLETTKLPVVKKPDYMDKSKLPPGG